MKNKTIRVLIAFALVFALVFALSSCSGNISINTATDKSTEQKTPVFADVTIKTDSVELTAKDGTTVYTGSVAYPYIEIEGNSAAADKINSYFSAQIEPILEPDEDYAKEYEQFVADGLEYFSRNDFSISAFTKRTDENIISFEIECSSYNAGAIHGESVRNGVCFSVRTGEKLEISDLMLDTTAFNAFLIERITDEITANYEPELLNQDYLETIGESVGTGELCWCLTDEVFRVYYNPYIIAPYAQGIIEVDIPLSELGEYLNTEIVL